MSVAPSWLSADTIVPAASCVVMAIMLPTAILISRDRLREHRRGLVLALEQWLYQTDNEPPITSFEAARIKYEMGPRDGTSADRGAMIYDATSKMSYLLPAGIYAALLSSCFFMATFMSRTDSFWDEQNFILSGMGTFDSPHALNLYQRNSGAAITAGFLGAFLFSLQYLIQRVRSYELSPISFLIAAITILEGCFVVSIARQLVSMATPYAVYAGLFFLIGYFPTFGVTWLLDRLRIRQLKTIDREAFLARYVMPTDMIDGVDMMIKFRLMESGVRDVQGLATANPVLLYVETPYTLLSILDWIGQAQLLLAVGTKPAAALRSVGIRTIAGLSLMGTSDASRALVLGKVWPSPTGQGAEASFKALCAVIEADLHVQRLRMFLAIMSGLMQRQHPNIKTGWPASGTQHAA